MSSFRDNIQIFRKCPELRREVMLIELSKASSVLTMVIFLPLLLVGLVAITVVHVFDYVGQAALWPAHYITNWLHELQRDTIRTAHSKLTVEEILARTGKTSDEDLDNQA
jgi:hypothetical protein